MVRPGEVETFERLAKPLSKDISYCALFDYATFRQLRGRPLTFYARIVSAADDNQGAAKLSYSDRAYTYVPAVYVGPSLSEAQLASDVASGKLTDPRVQGCSTNPYGLIVLAFPGQKSPPYDYIKVDSIAWWRSIYYYTTSEDGDAPIYLVGAYKPVRISQVVAPPYRLCPINLVLRSGPLKISFQRIEYTDNETRIWVSEYNYSTARIPAWPANSAVVRQGAGSDIQASPPYGADNPLSNDDLPAQDVPARGEGEIAGYMRFRALDPSRPLTLSIPDINTVNPDSDPLPISIKLPPCARSPL